MVQDKIILIAEKHTTWVDIVCTFGCTRRIAEDITQEMYIKIQLQLEKGTLDIMYNKDEINYYYIFKTLKTLFLDLKRKSKNITIIALDEYVDDYGDANYAHSEANYNEVYKIVEEELAKMHWWDRKIFEIINGGESIAEFSRKSNISYSILYNAYQRAKKKLKKLI
jgi:DNA-directed RNA polymerase specialized sigma24 family protein